MTHDGNSALCGAESGVSSQGVFRCTEPAGHRDDHKCRGASWPRPIEEHIENLRYYGVVNNGEREYDEPMNRLCLWAAEEIQKLREALLEVADYISRPAPGAGGYAQALREAAGVYREGKSG